jgi:hypothetical protein
LLLPFSNSHSSRTTSSRTAAPDVAQELKVAARETAERAAPQGPAYRVVTILPPRDPEDGAVGVGMEDAGTGVAEVPAARAVDAVMKVDADSPVFLAAKAPPASR